MNELAPLVGLVSSWIVGGVLLVAGAGKLRSPEKLAQVLQSYSFIPAVARRALSVVLPAAEVMLGVLVILGVQNGVFAPLAAVLFLVFALALTLAFGIRGAADCGCFGDASRRTSTSLLIGRTVSLVVLSLVVLAAGSPVLSPGSTALVLAFGAASLALACTFLRWEPAESSASGLTTAGNERRRFLRVAGSTVAGLAAAVSLGVAERRTAEASCFGCGTCGTDYIFLYCISPCCAMYWVRPYNYCGTSCPACSPRYQMFCGVQSCC